MRVRKMDAGSDMVFGGGQAAFYANQVEGAAQAIRTRLALWQGEWFLEPTEGMDWAGKVLGKYTTPVRDAAIKARVLKTPGVKRIVSYSSSFNGNDRSFTVSVTVDTLYGSTTVVETM